MELQLTYSRSHIQYMHTVLSSLGGNIGMSRKETEDMAKAVSEVFMASGKRIPNHDDIKVSVLLRTVGSSMTAEIMDRCTIIEPAPSGECFDDNGYCEGMEHVCRLVDSLEFERSCDGIMIRLTKSAGQIDRSNAHSTVQISALSPTGFQS